LLRCQLKSNMLSWHLCRIPFVERLVHSDRRAGRRNHPSAFIATMTHSKNSLESTKRIGAVVARRHGPPQHRSNDSASNGDGHLWRHCHFASIIVSNGRKRAERKKCCCTSQIGRTVRLDENQTRWIIRHRHRAHRIACGQFLVQIVAGINFLKKSTRRGPEHCPRREVQYIALPTTELASNVQTPLDGLNPR
jgi:hypothetical protein